MLKIAMISLMCAFAIGIASAQTVEQRLNANKSQISLADARSRIDKAIEVPAVMTAIMKHLSADDQRQFLADVNAAIEKMPASAEEKTAKYLNVNHAALKGAAPGNVSTLLAEVFATVSPEALTVISERFATDLLSRTADRRVTYSDQQFEQMSIGLMKKINERCEETDNGSPRAALAILMMIRASGGTSASLADALIGTMLHEDARELAKDEWIPSALAKDGREQSYESILASADAGRRPDLDFVLVIAGPQFHDSVLQDLFGKDNDPKSYMRTRTPVLDAVENPLLFRGAPVLGGNVGGDVAVGGASRPTGGDIEDGDRPSPGPEPGPYQWGRTR